MGAIKYLAISWAANFVVLWVVTLFLSGADYNKLVDLLIAAALFGVLNTILKLITVPLAVITLGVIWFFVAMLMLWITSAIVDGFEISGFWTYVWATVIAWAVNVVLDFVPGPWRGTR